MDSTRFIYVGDAHFLQDAIRWQRCVASNMKNWTTAHSTHMDQPSVQANNSEEVADWASFCMKKITFSTRRWR